MAFNQQTFVQATLKRVNEKAYRKAYNICVDATESWVAWFHTQMNKPKQGAIYQYRNWKGLLHHASAGGKIEYPADKTGNFLNNLRIHVGSYNSSGKFVRIYIGSDVPYTPFLANTRKLFHESKDEFFVKYFKSRLTKG